MFLSVLEAVASFGASSLLFSYISFLSIPFLVPGLVLDLVDVFPERLPGSSCAILPPLYVSFCHSWRFLLVLDCLWTQKPWKAMGRQRAAPLHKITRGDPSITMFQSVFANVASFGASSLLFSYFLSFHSFPCSCFGPGPCGCVPREISWKSSCSLRLFLPFLEILAGS